MATLTQRHKKQSATTSFPVAKTREHKHIFQHKDGLWYQCLSCPSLRHLYMLKFERASVIRLEHSHKELLAEASA